MLISQVLSDFVGEVKANIGTEIQMRTRYEGDLERINEKYGEDIVKSLVKSTIGTGMVENSEYNRGRPYFITFRPILHSVTRLEDKELNNYSKYNEILDELKYSVEQLEANKVDIFDLKLELNLAESKIRTGQFNIVDIYLESLKPKINDAWKKIGKQPPKREKKKVNVEEIKKSVEAGKGEREKFVKELKDLQNEKDRMERLLTDIKKDKEKTVQQKEQWLIEFESNIKKEKDLITKEKLESKSMFETAKDERIKVDKMLNEVSKKKNELDFKISETDKIRKEYELKLEKIKAMAQQV